MRKIRNMQLMTITILASRTVLCCASNKTIRRGYSSVWMLLMGYPATGKIQGEMERWGCHRGKYFPAWACPLWSGWDMKEQPQHWWGEIPGAGKALCPPTSRIIPRPAVWTTELTEPGEKQSKVTILSQVAQTQAHQLLWPVPKAVTPEGSRTAAPAA